MNYYARASINILQMIIGILHLIHCPSIILLPFYIVNNPVFDIFYIEYFFSIIFSYTFLNGECPISYIYKKQKDPNYIAGSRITDYTEMYDLFIFSPETQKYISIYFGTNTVLYIGSLLYVINRSNLPLTLFRIPTSSILIYFYFIYFSRAHPLFNVIQNTNKIILFLFILCLIRRDIYV